ncbi:MAG: beta-galactosidase [Isosphaeraceae bacterium]
MELGRLRRRGGRHGLALGALRLPAATSPAKRAILEQLRGKYGEIAGLNAAWKTSFRDWATLEAPWQPESGRPAMTDAFKADLRHFVKEFARAYFRTVRDELKAADPDHLYLGCRFAWRTEEAIAASTEFCDVVSFNIYERRVDPRKWDFLKDLGRPVIIGEFHAGALDRGMFHTGLVSAADQAERARSTRTTSGASWTTLAGWLPLVPVHRRAADRPLVRRRELQHRLPHGDRHALPRDGRVGPEDPRRSLHPASGEPDRPLNGDPGTIALPSSSGHHPATASTPT